MKGIVMRKSIFIIFTVFVINISMADDSELPTHEQALKLVEAAWKSTPISIDVTYYLTEKDYTKTEENIRQFYEELFDSEYGMDEDLSSEMLERKETDIRMNIDHDLAEQQQGGKKIKYRVRGDGKSYRVDRVYGSPGITIRNSLKGIAQEEFIPEKKIDENTSFEETFIETPVVANGYELYEYYHKNKIALAQKIKSSRTAIEDRKISNILKIPYASILQTQLGTQKNNLATEPYDINEPKIKQLCSGTLKNIAVKIKPDINEPEAKDRIEISLYNDEKKEFLTSLLICAKDDYSKVYYSQTPNPATNNPPILTRTCSNFDSQGIPHNVTDVQYDGKGNVLLSENYHIEEIRLNIPIPKEVFEFNPPDDYLITDNRLPEAQRQLAKIESLKKRTKDKNSGRRLEALIRLMEYLKDDPAQLGEVATSMLNDERPDIQKLAAVILKRIDSKKEEE